MVPCKTCIFSQFHKVGCIIAPISQGSGVTGFVKGEDGFSILFRQFRITFMLYLQSNDDWKSEINESRLRSHENHGYNAKKGDIYTTLTDDMENASKSCKS